MVYSFTSLWLVDYISASQCEACNDVIHRNIAEKRKPIILKDKISTLNYFRTQKTPVYLAAQSSFARSDNPKPYISDCIGASDEGQGAGRCVQLQQPAPPASQVNPNPYVLDRAHLTLDPKPWRLHPKNDTVVHKPYNPKP